MATLGRRCRASLPLALGLLLTAGTPAPQGRQKPVPLNVLLLTLDTTRADHLGAWGWPHARTPNLDALAARGVRFSRCDTAAPITLPSHATILTGLFPPRHGARDNGTFVVAPAQTTLAERLRGAGYRTAAVVSSRVLARHYGLDQGFDSYDDDVNADPAHGTRVDERSASGATAAARAALDGPQPFFLWVHYFDPHAAYQPPPALAASATGPTPLYDAEIAFVDQAIGDLLASLPPNTVVAVVGDHGEMLGEHGEATHGLLLYPGARRVPLILAGPGLPAGRTVECLVRTADLVPTLLGLAKLPVPDDLDGRSLLPLLGDAPPCDRLSYVESFLPFYSHHWYPLRALADDSWLYLDAPQPSLYDLARDAAESRDLAAQEPARTASWAQRLSALLADMGESLHGAAGAAQAASEEERRRLTSLGYLGGAGGGTVSGALPDPRGMTAVAQELHDIAISLQTGRCGPALDRLRVVLRRDPHNVAALDYATQCLLQAGRWADALRFAETAARENPSSPTPRINRASALAHLGEKTAAMAEYRQALVFDPSSREAAVGLARLLRDGGQATEALAVLDRSIAAGARDPGNYLERGITWAELGRIDKALADFEEAARRDPQNPLPIGNAARAADRLGRLGEAVGLYERLLTLEPGNTRALEALGSLHFKLHQPEPALRRWRQALALERDPIQRQRIESLIRQLDE